MSRSRGDQRGKRINKEIMGRGCFAVDSAGRAVKEVGGEEVGSANRKKDAKQELGRLRRRTMKQIPTE